jgi:hypothetical protein
MARKRKPDRVREPVQVYLDQQDRALLESLARETGLSRAELIRRGLRRLAGDELTQRRPGWSLDILIGTIPEGPKDLAARHDDYLYGHME